MKQHEKLQELFSICILSAIPIIMVLSQFDICSKYTYWKTQNKIVNIRALWQTDLH